MPTFLTTRKMPPELAARIEARLTGRRAPAGRSVSPLAVSALRFVGLALVVTLVVSYVMFRQAEQRELEAERSALAERLKVAAEGITDEDRALPARIEEWLSRGAGPWSGDRIAKQLSEPGALDALLKKPTIYVRGELDDFLSPAGIRGAAVESRKDAFLLCLIEPPASDTEKDQLRKVVSAYAGGERMNRATSHVERLADLQVGLPLLSAEWRRELQAAKTRAEIAERRRAFELAPVEGARRAAKAKLLVFVVDEPGGGRGPAELDGERPHQVRIGIVDLAANKLLLQLRRDVDPKWISQARRAEYARGLDACKLALDVRKDVTQKPDG